MLTRIRVSRYSKAEVYQAVGLKPPMEFLKEHMAQWDGNLPSGDLRCTGKTNSIVVEAIHLANHGEQVFIVTSPVQGMLRNLHHRVKTLARESLLELSGPGTGFVMVTSPHQLDREIRGISRPVVLYDMIEPYRPWGCRQAVPLPPPPPPPIGEVRVMASYLVKAPRTKVVGREMGYHPLTRKSGHLVHYAHIPKTANYIVLKTFGKVFRRAKSGVAFVQLEDGFTFHVNDPEVYIL